jgi:uncharacterized membrane protein YecN with MAPEG domain
MLLSAPAIILTAAVTLLAVVISIGAGILVARTRRATGIHPPVMTGDPRLERALRVQGNTLEQFAVFVPALWVATLYFPGWWAPALGLVWCTGRLIYAVLYMRARPRFLGFGLTIFPTLILIVLAAIGVAQAWLASA